MLTLPGAVQRGVVVGDVGHISLVRIEIGECTGDQCTGLGAAPRLTSARLTEPVYPAEAACLGNAEGELAVLATVGKDSRNTVLGHDLAKQDANATVVADNNVVRLNQLQFPKA